MEKTKPMVLGWLQVGETLGSLGKASQSFQLEQGIKTHLANPNGAAN